MTTGRTLTLTLVAALTLLLTVACANTDAIRANDLQVVEITAHPGQWMGKNVRVEGPVARIVSSRSFTLGEGDNTLLVLLNPASMDVNTVVATGKLVTVAGEVRMLTGFEDAIWTGVDLDAHRSWLDAPIMIGNAVYDAD